MPHRDLRDLRGQDPNKTTLMPPASTWLTNDPQLFGGSKTNNSLLLFEGTEPYIDPFNLSSFEIRVRILPQEKIWLLKKSKLQLIGLGNYILE